MARANRHHLPGYVWHITHRCHKREYNQRKNRKGAFWEDRYHATAVKTGKHLTEYHRKWVEEVLKNGSNQRDAKWTQSIAVGDKEFVMETKAKLCAKAIGRREMKNVEGYELRESQNPYNRVFDPEKCCLRLKNDHIWQDSYLILSPIPLVAGPLVQHCIIPEPIIPLFQHSIIPIVSEAN